MNTMNTMTKSYEEEKEDTVEIVMYMLTVSRREHSKANEMLNTVFQNMSTWSISKLNRWIGYAQCLLVAEGATTIDKLREETRK